MFSSDYSDLQINKLANVRYNASTQEFNIIIIALVCSSYAQKLWITEKSRRFN